MKRLSAIATPARMAPVLLLCLLVLFLFLPIWGMLRASLMDNETGAISLVNYREILGTGYYRMVAANSLLVAMGGTAGALFLGLPLAWIMDRFVIRGRRLVTVLVVMSLISPPLIGAYAWIVLFGRSGIARTALLSLGLETPTVYGGWGIVLCFSLQYYPFVFLFVTGALQSINHSLEEAADNLGAGPVRKFFTVTLPLISPAVSSAALMVFMMSVANFGTPVIIGQRFKVLSAVAYNQYTSELGGNLGLASTLSILMILCSCMALFIQVLLSRGKKVSGSRMRTKPPRKIPDPLQGALLHFLCYTTVFVSTLPLLVVVAMSFKNASGPVFIEGFGWGNYRHVLGEIPLSIQNSLIIALASVLVLVSLGSVAGYAISRTRSPLNVLVDHLLVVPFIVPGTVLGIGYITCFNSGPVVLTGTYLIIISASCTRRLPYSVRSAAAIVRQIPRTLEEASLCMGKGPAETFWRISLPLMKPGIAAGALLSFVMVINELSASAVLFTGKTVTMPVRIYQSVTNGDFGPAAALSTVLLLMTAAGILLIQYVTRRNEVFWTR